MSGRVEGKVALVTGAESAAGGIVGLARASALMLADQGAKVVATDIAAKTRGSVVEEILGRGGEAIFHRHDVSRETDWQDAIATALDAYGKLDILVNMAAIPLDGSVEDTTLEDWRRHMAVNLDGVFLGTQYGVRAMKESGGGSIVNVSSIYGLVGGDSLAAYCAAKAGGAQPDQIGGTPLRDRRPRDSCKLTPSRLLPYADDRGLLAKEGRVGGRLSDDPRTDAVGAHRRGR